LTSSELLLMLQTIGALTMQREYREVKKYCARPLSFYARDKFFLIRTSHQLEEGLRRHAGQMQANGVSRVRPTILRVEDRSEARCLAVVRWDHLDASGDCVLSNTIRYVVRQSPERMRPLIELVEYLEVANQCWPERLFDLEARA